ncbi:MAG: ATP-dependent Zn protease, partial [Candidatus Omnitrophota bacterium]
MKKFVIFLQVHWVKILIITIGALALGGTGYYIFTSSSNYASLEPYTRRQLSGQMAAMMPMFLIVQVIAILMMLGVQMYMMSGGTMSSFSKKKLNEAKMDVKWADVIGMETAKKEAWEIVSLLKDRSKVKAIGGNIVKGTMFLGPPGCGKTYLAKAMATECGLPMITAVGSEFVAMFMGQGAARIKALFKQARNMAKIEGGCIIFIDEIDAFAQPRQMERGGGATTSANATINQFLTELDGVRHKENNIVVFAATNCDEDALDPALMRSGRFDRKIHIEKPNATERVKLIEFYLSRVDADPQIDINHFAEKAQWFSPSDINNMVRESAIIALRNNNPQIKTKDLEAGLRRVLTSVEQMGEDKILSDKTNVRWDDLIGMKETKRDAWEIVELLKDRQKLKVIGGQIVKGIMMIGAPGCGKTYLAKAMATESGFPFISVTGSDFVNKIYAGTGIKKLKNVFEEARKVAKAENGCIIFIDEIDAFIRPRNPDPFSHAQNQSSDHQVINQFLAEMDGLKGDSNNIIVIAATNIPEENLDEAVMRSGRFDRKIYFHKPNAKDRASLLEFYLKKVKFEKTIDIPTLAEKARCFSPADINNMVREAGIFTLREKRDTLNMDDLEKAMKRVMTSLERRGENKILGEHVNVKWDDIIGMDDAKEETWEIVKMLKDHKLVKASGGKIVKGVVLFGPPGCGKTYLAKAMATESGYPFMNIVGSEVVGMYVGQGAHKIREIFREARELARAEGGCIVFFDEFDSFTRPRVSPSGMGGGISHNAAINQFLTELDGLRQAENNIIVLGATNVTEHDIDPAILRSGRLERKVYVKHPTLEDRKKLFSFYLKNITHDESLDPNRLARMCVGFTPAKIENIIRE